MKKISTQIVLYNAYMKVGSLNVQWWEANELISVAIVCSQTKKKDKFDKILVNVSNTVLLTIKIACLKKYRK